MRNIGHTWPQWGKVLGLFERRRRLMDDWAAYLAGERRDPEAQRVG